MHSRIDVERSTGRPIAAIRERAAIEAVEEATARLELSTSCGLPRGKKPETGHGPCDLVSVGVLTQLRPPEFGE